MSGNIITFDDLKIAKDKAMRELVKITKRELKKDPSREFNEFDARIMSRELYDRIVQLFKKEQHELESMRKYNKLLGRARKRR